MTNCARCFEPGCFPMRFPDEKVVFCPLTSLQEDIYLTILQTPDVLLIRKKNCPCDCGSGEDRGHCCYTVTSLGFRVCVCFCVWCLCVVCVCVCGGGGGGGWGMPPGSEIPYPISDQNIRLSIPYFRPGSQNVYPISNPMRYPSFGNSKYIYGSTRSPLPPGGLWALISGRKPGVSLLFDDRETKRARTSRS